MPSISSLGSVCVKFWMATPMLSPSSERQISREMTEEEAVKYEAQVEASDGFEVDYIPGVRELGQVFPIDFSYTKSKEFCTALAMFSVDVYNQYLKDTGAQLEFVDVLRATVQSAGDLRYFITFSAKDHSSGGEIVTYQTMVFYGNGGMSEVGSFRTKPVPGQKKNWIWVSNFCSGGDDDGIYAAPGNEYSKIIIVD